MSGTREAEQVRRAQQGDRRAFGDLVERHRGAVFGLCLHLLGSVDDAQDATQDAFLRAYQRLAQLRDPAAFPAWLATIARRECRHLRRRRPEASAGEPTETADGTRDTSERLDRERLAARLREHLQALPPDTRLIYLLSCLDGLTSQRIGAFLGLKPGTVRARLHRARRRLAEALDSEDAAERRKAFEHLAAEVIPVSINYCSAGGPYPEAAFPDDTARSLYGYLYVGVPWQEAAGRIGVPESEAETYLRTWERYLVVEREGDRLRPLVPVKLRSDGPGIRDWQQGLARYWTQAVAARNARVERLAQEAAPEGWVATAREALCLFMPSAQLHVALAARGLYLPPLARPSGPCYLFAYEYGEGDPGPDDYGFGLSDPQTGDNTYRLSAVIWWHCQDSPEVGRFLDRGNPFNPLPRALASFRTDPPSSAEAERRLSGAIEQRYGLSAENLLERLVRFRVLSPEAPHRLLLPAFVGDLACEARALASEIAEELADQMAQGRETLEELIRGSSFAGCNRADVDHLLSSGVLLVALGELVDAGLISPFPKACFADRGPYLIEVPLFA